MTKRFLLLLTFLTLLICSSIAGITNPKVKWKFKTAGTIRGGVVVDAGVVYVGSADGFLYAVHASDGHLIWKFQTNGSIAGTPAIDGSTVVVTSRDNVVYALDVKNGHLLWKFEMKPVLKEYTEWEYYTAAPVVFGRTLYVGSGDGNVYALDLNTGNLLWKYQAGARIRATPLVTKDFIYQPCNDGMVYILTTRDGKLVSKLETTGASLGREYGFDRTNLFSTPCLKNSILMFGSRDGFVYGVDVRTKKEKWKFTYGPTWAYATIADDENLYIGWSTNKLFSAVDIATGKEKWKFESGSVNYTTAAIHDHDLIFGSADGKLYCLDKNTGVKKWAYETGFEIFSSPATDSSSIYFGCDDGFLYALEEGVKPYKAVYQPMPDSYTNYPVLDHHLAPYLKDRGFTQLDSAELFQFFSHRIDDKAPSVIVFAYDAIPQNIMGENPETGMVRKYLEAGGKIIWLGSIPNVYSFTATGKMMGTTRNPTVAMKLLDITFDTPEESGNYYCTATQEGLNLGLPAWFKATHSTVSNKDVIPLAFDEWGRVGPWMKKFNSRSGSGFISCRPWAWEVPIREADLNLIHKLAVYALE